MRHKGPGKPVARLAGDVEVLCAIIARVLTRIVQQHRARRTKA